MGTNKAEGKGIIVASLLFLVLSVLCDLLSYTVFHNAGNITYLLRMFSRGDLGLLFVMHSAFLLFTTKKYFLSPAASRKERLIIGILTGLLGMGMVVTAVLGYGVNGDPRYLWWK